jgi:hypothetical protein
MPGEGTIGLKQKNGGNGLLLSLFVAAIQEEQDSGEDQQQQRFNDHRQDGDPHRQGSQLDEADSDCG